MEIKEIKDYVSEVLGFAVTELTKGGHHIEEFRIMIMMPRYLRWEELKPENFSFQDQLKIIKQLALAVKLFHDNNIVHRDIKEANILFEKIDNAYILRLSDFGSTGFMSDFEKNQSR